MQIDHSSFPSRQVISPSESNGSPFIGSDNVFIIRFVCSHISTVIFQQGIRDTTEEINIYDLKNSRGLNHTSHRGRACPPDTYQNWPKPKFRAFGIFSLTQFRMLDNVSRDFCSIFMSREKSEKFYRKGKKLAGPSCYGQNQFKPLQIRTGV